MGKISYLTKEQQIILAEIKSSDFICSKFYFTGGTALSSFYLHHRYSEDLDIFSENRFDNQIILALVTEWSKKHRFAFQSRFVEVMYIFNLTFPNDNQLKLDFSYYPYARAEKGIAAGGLVIDSLLDIAINKLLTITQRNDVKDFVDLYFLLKSKKFSLWDLLEGVRVKFNMELEPILLASDFLKSEDMELLPKMIAPLKLDELRNFYRDLAKRVGSEAVE